LHPLAPPPDRLKTIALMARQDVDVDVLDRLRGGATVVQEHVDALAGSPDTRNAAAQR
jgi:hypothetical protein